MSTSAWSRWRRQSVPGSADAFGSAAGEARVSRIHGDYHLGQLLARPDGGFSVIDFEGEPAGRWRSAALRPRRCATWPACSVASTTRPAPPSATGWPRRGRGCARAAAFLGAYGGSWTALLPGFELEKACYESAEAGMCSPDWLCAGDGRPGAAGRTTWKPPPRWPSSGQFTTRRSSRSAVDSRAGSRGSGFSTTGGGCRAKVIAPAERLPPWGGMGAVRQTQWVKPSAAGEATGPRGAAVS